MLCSLHQQNVWFTLTEVSSKRMLTSTHQLLYREDYEKLGVKKNASRKEIKTAYFKVAKELHPDSNSNQMKNMDLTYKFHELNEAYQRLMTEAAFGKNSYDNSKYDRHKRTMDQQGWYAGPDSKQLYFSNTRVFLRNLNMAFRAIVLIFFGFVCVRQFLIQHGLL